MASVGTESKDVNGAMYTIIISIKDNSFQEQ